MTTTVVYHGPGSFDSDATGEVDHAEPIELPDGKAEFAVGHRQFVYQPGEYTVTTLKKIVGGLSDDVKETMAELERDGEHRTGALNALDAEPDS